MLTRGNSLSINDQHEALMKGAWEEWNQTYIGSFAYGHAENMAMWGLYGLPAEDAIRIAIPRRAMNIWIDSISDMYLWENNPVAQISGKVHLSDIVYVDGRSGSNNLQLTHNNNTIWTANKIGLHGVDKNPEMTGYIKNYAWRYENEVRMHIRLEQNTGYERIMIKIPPEVLGTIEITTGPSFRYKNDELYETLNEQGMIKPSGFTNLVHYRPLCAYCKNSPFTRKR